MEISDSANPSSSSSQQETAMNEDRRSSPAWSQEDEEMSETEDHASHNEGRDFLVGIMNKAAKYGGPSSIKSKEDTNKPKKDYCDPYSYHDPREFDVGIMDFYVDVVTGEEEPILDGSKDYYKANIQPYVRPDSIFISDSDNPRDTFDMQVDNNSFGTNKSITSMSKNKMIEGTPINAESCFETIEDVETPMDLESESPYCIDDKEQPSEVSSELCCISVELELLKFDSSPDQHQNVTFACQESEVLTVLKQNVPKPGQFNCSDCKKSFISSKNLRKHQQHKHGSEKDCSGELPISDQQPVDKTSNVCLESYLTKPDQFLVSKRKSENMCLDSPSLTDHKLTNKTSKLFQCNLCKISCTSLQDLDFHQFNDHTAGNESQNKTSLTEQQEISKKTTERFKCDKCEMSFTLMRNLDHHLFKYHGIRQKSHRQKSLKEKYQVLDETVTRFKCSECENSFKKEDFHFHQFRKHGTGKGFPDQPPFNEPEFGVQKNVCYICFRCKDTYSIKEQLVIHQCRNLGSKEKYFEPLTLTDLKFQVIATRQYDCFHCEECFDRKGSVISHTLNVHKNEINVAPTKLLPYADNIMPQEQGVENELSDTELYRVDQQSSSSSKTFSHHEGKMSTFKKNLPTHQRDRKRTKSKNPKKPTSTFLQNVGLGTCFVCGERFATKDLLASHLQQVHSNQKPYRCSECSMRFNDNTDLLKHRQSHHLHRNFPKGPSRTMTSSAIFKCERCGKTFHSQRNLRQHSLRCLPPEQFECTHCERTFDRKTCLMTHLKSHTKRPHCSECGEACSDQLSLVQHMRRHLNRLKR